MEGRYEEIRGKEFAGRITFLNCRLPFWNNLFIFSFLPVFNVIYPFLYRVKRLPSWIPVRPGLAYSLLVGAHLPASSRTLRLQLDYRLNCRFLKMKLTAPKVSKV